MKRLLKQVVGIDAAQKELVVSIGCMHDDLGREIYCHHTFSNTTKGFEALSTWVRKRADVSIGYIPRLSDAYQGNP